MVAASTRRGTTRPVNVDNYAERVDAAAMSTLMTEPAAAALIVVDEINRATLSEIARVTGRPLSTVQRAVDGLLDAGILGRPTPRAPVCFAEGAPRDALRRLADWRLGPRAVGDLLERLHDANIDAVFPPPPSIGDPEIRRAWPGAMRSIVSAFHPERVVLFGSQARGDARPGSDVDLLVVFDKVEDRRERRVQLRRVLNHQPFAKDVLVADRADIARPPLGSALAEALREGVTVYER
jgi:predicted nucleotidyltransferase